MRYDLMKKLEKTEQEYVEKIIRLMREGALQNAFRQLFSVGVVAGLVWLFIVGVVFIAYLRLGGTKDDWRFIFGLTIGTLLCPSIFIFGTSLARILKDIESRDARSFTLMVKYHDHLVREGLDPYEEPKS
jgi:hypothetical protein